MTEFQKITKLFNRIVLYILILATIGLLSSYLTPIIQSTGFFGDILLQDPHHYGMDENYDWGWRHYIYFTTTITLFVSMIIRFMFYVADYWDTDLKNK